jgi:hypothetical protein
MFIATCFISHDHQALSLNHICLQRNCAHLGSQRPTKLLDYIMIRLSNNFVNFWDPKWAQFLCKRVWLKKRAMWVETCRNKHIINLLLGINKLTICLLRHVSTHMSHHQALSLNHVSLQRKCANFGIPNGHSFSVNL